MSIQDGAKRVCSVNPRHRLYPRTDPVVCFPFDIPADRTMGMKGAGECLLDVATAVALINSRIVGCLY